MLQIGDLIQRYQSNAEDRPSTIRNNSSSLRLLIRTVHGGDPDQRSSALLTGDLIREFERIRRTTATTESARRRARASIRSYVVQARSVLAPRKMRFYEDLNLPDLDGFRKDQTHLVVKPDGFPDAAFRAEVNGSSALIEEPSQKHAEVLPALALRACVA